MALCSRGAPLLFTVAYRALDQLGRSLTVPTGVCMLMYLLASLLLHSEGGLGMRWSGPHLPRKMMSSMYSWATGNNEMLRPRTSRRHKM